MPKRKIVNGKRPKLERRVSVCLLLPETVWTATKNAAKAADLSACQYVRRALQQPEAGK
jgi:hypothetical protein